MGSPAPGSSAVVGPDGRVLSKPDSPTEQLIIADLDLSLVTKTKTFADASGHCKPEVLGFSAGSLLITAQIVGRICCGWDMMIGRSVSLESEETRVPVPLVES